MTEFDMDKALLDPGALFDKPEDVVAHGGLDTSQKIEILRRWEYDASETCVAVEEGMAGGVGPESDLLRRILLALSKLGAGVDVERIAPSKQHGLPSSAVEKD